MLALSIAAPIAVQLGHSPPAALPAGRYLYCGSAYGPGGMRARLARHFRRDKSLRWHVDQLTTRGLVAGAWAIAEGDECELVQRLGFLPMPIDGFGASDCAHCRTHLLRWPRRVPQRAIVTALAGGGAAPMWVAAEVTRRFPA